jgi:hypothetical protein
VARRRADYAKSKNLDPDVFPTSRLAPDQFALERQAQIACDTVKLGHSYLTDKAAQPQEDNEKTSPNCRRAFGRIREGRGTETDASPAASA